MGSEETRRLISVLLFVSLNKKDLLQITVQKNHTLLNCSSCDSYSECEDRIFFFVGLERMVVVVV